MIENPLLKLLTVSSVFLTMFLLFTILGVLVIKFRLYNTIGLVISSLGTGVIFGGGFLALIMLSDKFSNWTFEDKFKYAGEISIVVFVIAMIFITVTFNKNNKLKH